MHRTQVYLESSQYEMIKARARREGNTLAQVIRESVEAYLQPVRMRSMEDPLHKIIGIGKGDGSAVAENYEDFLYGEKS